MVILVQLITGFISTISVNATNAYTRIDAYNEPTELLVLSHPSEFANEKVFQILDNKCNVCHRKQNKRRVFTSNNMDTWANAIYKQVFIKKRMPKGNKIKLTANEYQELLTWITSTKSKQNGTKL